MSHASIDLIIIAISPRGVALGERVLESFPHSNLYALSHYVDGNAIPITEQLSAFIPKMMAMQKPLLLVMACGIAVRCIAAGVQSKKSDPPVMVADDGGNFVISLLSGHMGGANQLSQIIADAIQAKPVITTASDLCGLEAVDMFAHRHGLIIDNWDDAKLVTAVLLNGGKVGLRNYSLIDVNNNSFNRSEPFDAFVHIGHYTNTDNQLLTVKLYPRNLVLGLGCRKDTNPVVLSEFVNDQLDKLTIHKSCIGAVASVDIKQHETAILQYAQSLCLDACFVSVNDIRQEEHLFNRSQFVQKSIGVGAVCEPAAYIVGKKKGRFLLHKTVYKGITMSLFESEYIIKPENV
jgi:cobalt-precorrin 5A hydrolase